MLWLASNCHWYPVMPKKNTPQKPHWVIFGASGCIAGASNGITMVTFHVDITTTPVVPAVLAQWRELVSEFMISWDFMEIHWVWWDINSGKCGIRSGQRCCPFGIWSIQNLHVCYFKSSVWYLEIRCPQIKRRKNASGLVKVPIKHHQLSGDICQPLGFSHQNYHLWGQSSILGQTFPRFRCKPVDLSENGGIPDINDSIKKDNADRLSNLAGI